MTTPTKTNRMTRRRLLGGVATAPFAGSAALAGCAADPEAAEGPTLARLESANALTSHPLAAERLRAILPAARMNHAFFRAVRELEISDLTEPAVRFVPGPAPAETGS